MSEWVKNWSESEVEKSRWSRKAGGKKGVRTGQAWYGYRAVEETGMVPERGGLQVCERVFVPC